MPAVLARNSVDQVPETGCCDNPRLSSWRTPTAQRANALLASFPPLTGSLASLPDAPVRPRCAKHRSALVVRACVGLSSLINRPWLSGSKARRSARHDASTLVFLAHDDLAWTELRSRNYNSPPTVLARVRGSKCWRRLARTTTSGARRRGVSGIKVRFPRSRFFGKTGKTDL